MKFMYFFDDKIKCHIMRGRKYCNPAETGKYECGINIYPNAQVYLGKEERAYLNGTTHRMTKLGVKLKNCVKIEEEYRAIDHNEVFDIEGIKVQAIHTPGHTLGHTCYVFPLLAM